MRITSGVDHKKSSVKDTECVSQKEWIIRKVVLKLGKGITTGVDHKESSVKVTECV